MNIVSQPIAAEPQLAQMIRFKGTLIWEIRKYLHGHGALEIPMPIMHRTREGAPVDQLSTVCPITGRRMYLRHCMEDHLRRVSAAHDRVFEIGKAIRAESETPMHAHEFVVLELVFRGCGYDEGVDFVRGLLAEAVASAVETAYCRGDAFRQVSVRRWDDIFEQVTGFAPGGSDFIAACNDWLRDHNISTDKPYTHDWEVLEDIMKYAVEPACIAPTLITYFPKELQHVCDIDKKVDRALRVSSVISGVEISDGGVKFAHAKDYRRVYIANAEYRRDVLGLNGNELPEDFFADIDAMGDSAFTTGIGIDRIVALVAGCDIKRALIFPEE